MIQPSDSDLAVQASQRIAGGVATSREAAGESDAALREQFNPGGDTAG
ncbi:MAG: hypothetical protein P8127_01545 [Acidobacteriota bacterium]